MNMTAKSEVRQVEVKSIELSGLNPRKDFGKRALEDLKASIEAHGVIVPLIVRPRGKNYELVAGERRYRAAKAAKLKTVPVIVREVEDDQVLEVMLLENLQREDLKPFEEGAALVQLVNKVGLSQAEIGRRVGKSPGWISARLRMLELPKELHRMYDKGHIGVEGLVLLIPYVQHTKFMERVVKELESHSSYRDYHRARDVKDAVSTVLRIKSLAFVVSGDPWPSDTDKLVDKKECKSCSKKFKYKSLYTREFTYCLNSECFRPKVNEAKKKVRERNKKLKEEASSGKGVLDLRNKDRKTYRPLAQKMESYDYKLKFNSPQCNKCPHKVQGESYHGKGSVCTKPSCWEAKAKVANQELDRLRMLNANKIRANMELVLEAPPEDLVARILREYLVSRRLFNNETNKLVFQPWFKKKPKGDYEDNLDKIPDEDLPVLVVRWAALSEAHHAESFNNLDREVARMMPELLEGCKEIPDRVKVRD
jgi:ParB/RepB/Spo0J family partition protein